jgi:hypothetical protein
VKVGKNIRRIWLGIVLVSLSFLGMTLVGTLRPASATPTGTYFDHVIIIAMENTPYASVFGSGTTSSCPTSSAPFLCSMLPYSSTIPIMNNYGATTADANDFNGCSAACYIGLMFGYTYGQADGFSFSGISSNPQFINSLSSAGLTYGLYCSESCPRGNDHFPFPLSGSNSYTSSSVTYQDLINAANSASPPNFLWFTPTDSENMHDVSVQVGDSYLQSVLVGSGSMASPASGSLLASSLFTNPSYHTLLYLWWDECGGNNGSCDGNNDAPNLFYGSMVKKGYVSPDSAGIDEYACLWTLENNWSLPTLAQGDAAAKSAGYNINDIFTSGGSSSSLSASFTYSPSTMAANQAITFSAAATGGTGPYTYSWDFGDGNTATGASPTHTYTTAGPYTITMTATDNNGATTTKTQTVAVGQPSQGPSNSQPSGTGTSLFPMLSLLAIGVIIGGAAGATLYLARYRAQNRLLQNMMENRGTVTESRYNVRSSGYGGKALNGPIKRVRGEHARSDDID